jgi:predicted permease
MRARQEDAKREVERELAFHLEMRAREFEAAGLSGEAARRSAEAAFGDIAAVATACRAERARRSRERRRREMWRGLGGDVRFGARGLRRHPGFAAAAVLTLGAGMAIAATMVALTDAYLLRPLPYPDAERLVVVEGPGSPDWRAAPAVFEHVAAWDLDALAIVGGEAPERVWTSWVSPGFFDALGVRPALGRLFTAEEVAAGGRALAVISHGVWQRRWGGDPDVLGRTFAAYSDDRPDEAELFTVIGVLPADFWYANRFTEVLAPLRGERAVTLATLAPGVTPAVAEAALARQAAERDPARAEVRVRLMQSAYVEGVRPVLLAVGSAVALVLLIACGNATLLLLVRAAGRGDEFAVRVAIGAGRGRIVRQLVVEGLMVSAAAAAVGLALGWLLLGLVRGTLPVLLGTPVPGGAVSLGMSVPVFVAAAITTAVAGTLFGLVPLAALGRRDVTRSLAAAGRGTDARATHRLRGGLVVAELALSLALLVCAGLLVRSALHLQRLALGFEPDGVVAIGLSLRQRDYGDAPRRAVFYDRVLREIETSVPGAAPAFVSWAPFSRVGAVAVETPESPARRPGDAAPERGRPEAALRSPRAPATPVSSPGQASVQMVSPSYFQVLGIAIRRGRVFDSLHNGVSEPVAVVGESLARSLWPAGDPIGRRLRVVTEPDPQAPPGRDTGWLRVIGVVADVRKTLVAENPPDLYVPIAQRPPILAELVVTGAAGLERLDAVRAAVWRVNPELPLNEVRRLDEDVALASLPARFLAWLLSGFALFAVVLATLALYGVVAFAVTERRREIAVRMALGADARAVVRLFLRQATVLVAAGMAAGLAGGFALSRILRSQLFGVAAGDLTTYAGVALALGAAAFAATWVPARRAARAHPMGVLRGD